MIVVKIAEQAPFPPAVCAITGELLTEDFLDTRHRLADDWRAYFSRAGLHRLAEGWGKVPGDEHAAVLKRISQLEAEERELTGGKP